MHRRHLGIFNGLFWKVLLLTLTLLGRSIYTSLFIVPSLEDTLGQVNLHNIIATDYKILPRYKWTSTFCGVKSFEVFAVQED